jgi:beta-mannosidase
VKPLASEVYGSFDRAELLKGLDAQHAFAVFDLVVGGKIVSSNVYLFDRTRNLALPAAKIDSQLAATTGGYSLKLTSQVLARNVFVSFGDSDVEVSDNYFDLLPNEPLTIQLKSKDSVDKIRAAMEIHNIVDAFSK